MGKGETEDQNSGKVVMKDSYAHLQISSNRDMDITRRRNEAVLNNH